MNNIVLQKKYVLEYICDLLSDFKASKKYVKNAKYHHNTSYNVASSIIKHGILSLDELNKLKIKNYSEFFLKLMDDTSSHVNGRNGVSLSVFGLTDLYQNEDEYNPFNSYLVDFSVTSDIKAFRNSTNYGNEYVSLETITPDKIKAVDIRLISLIESLKLKILSDENYEEIVRDYNSLMKIAEELKQSNLDIPFREMSYSDSSAFDIDKVAKSPIIILKK